MASRRDFLKDSGAAAATGMLIASAGFRPARGAATNASSSRPILKVGLVGCGDRGTGAVLDAMAADADVRLTAMGDAFADRLKASLELLQGSEAAAQIQVTPETSFSGLDAYQKVIENADVVILTTPPAFRPQHLQAAIAANKHVFCEKPVAVDAPGVRSVLATAAEAKRRNLSLLSGFCWRANDAMRESMRRIHRGDIGRIKAVHSTFYTNTLTTKYTGAREPGWTDLEWQMRNWYYFHWLSGDHLVEQAVHSVDKIAWIMEDRMPVQALGSGGRQVPMAFGNNFDHYSVSYEYADGARAFLHCRQQDNCYNENTDYALGTQGLWNNGRGIYPEIIGDRGKKWSYPPTTDDMYANMYRVEHKEFFAAIRAGKPLNQGVRMANSTLMAIMGRMAAYTGRAISWEEALNSKELLVPERLDWRMTPPSTGYALPGQTPFV